MRRRHEQTFLQRRHINGQQTHEKMFNITHHQGRQIKTTMMYHLALLRMAKIKITRNNRCWQGCGEIRNLLHCWWECKLVQPLWKTIWSFLKTLKIELPYDPAILLPCINPENTKTLIQGIHAPLCLLQHYIQ